MPGVHKNKTIAFRPEEWERIIIEEKAASRFLVFHKASDFSDGTDSRGIMLLLLWRLC